MKTDWEKHLTEDGKRLRGVSFPPGLEESLQAIGKGSTRPGRGRAYLFAVGAAAVLIALLTGIKGVIPWNLPAGERTGEARASLITPSRLTPVRSLDEPLCAAIYPPLHEGDIRVFFDEQDLTAFAERNESFIILDLPELTRSGSHLFRLEITDRNGNVIGEPSWLIYTL